VTTDTVYFSSIKSVTLRISEIRMRYLKFFFVAYKRPEFIWYGERFFTKFATSWYTYTAGVGNMAFVVKLATDCPHMHIYSSYISERESH